MVDIDALKKELELAKQKEDEQKKQFEEQLKRKEAEVEARLRAEADAKQKVEADNKAKVELEARLKQVEEQSQKQMEEFKQKLDTLSSSKVVMKEPNVRSPNVKAFVEGLDDSALEDLEKRSAQAFFNDDPNWDSKL